MLNHFKILNSQKLTCLVGLFGLKSFHEFVSLVQLEDVTDCLSSVLFCIIALFFMAGNSKSIQKTSICSNKNTEKELNNVTYFQMKTHQFSTPSHSFFKEQDKVSKNNWQGEKPFKEICGGNQNGTGFFQFCFLTISYHNRHCF